MSAVLPPAVDLSRFCANEDDPREYLRTPWRDGAWVYATNGHLMVRVPAATAPDAVARDKHPDGSALFTTHLDGGTGNFILMPRISQPMGCVSCRGKGKFNAYKCDECDEGVFIHGRHRYECKECDGPDGGSAPAGWIKSSDKNDPIKLCSDCFGLGVKRYQRLEIGGQGFQHVYLWWMSKLPQARFRAGNNPITDAGCFIGDGWQALVMPMREA